MFRPLWPGQLCSLGYHLVGVIEADLGITLTREQAGRVVRYYELDRRSGARVVRRASLRRPKGSGKSPEGGYLAYVELVDDVVFDGWDDGQPLGRPQDDPWIQLAAVSEDQTDNVMVWLFDTLRARPATLAERGIDLGRTRIYLAGRPGRIEPVTASSDSREGGRTTFAVLDQTEAWNRSNGGVALAGTIRRNVAKVGGWTLELQNAPEPGDGSVADRTERAAERSAAGVLHDTRTAPEVDLADRDALLAALRVAYGDAAAGAGGWVDLERLADEIQDPDTDPADAKRFYLNQCAVATERAWDMVRWAELGGQEPPANGGLIVLGFDGARFDDSTAIVATEISSGVSWLAGMWEKPDRLGVDDAWQIDESDVTATMAELFDSFDVWRAYCDPAWWQTAISEWAGRWGDKRVIEWHTNRWSQIGHACRNLAGDLRAGLARHVDDDVDGDRWSRHMLHSVRRPVNARDEQGRRLWTLAKESPGRKIDAAMAYVLSWEARNDAIAANAQPTRRKRAVAKSYW